MPRDLSLDWAQARDAADPLGHFRRRFHLPLQGDRPAVYFCGHSLGLQPKGVRGLILEELEDWRRLAVHAHFAGRRPWVSYHEQLSALAAELVGAEPLEVVAMNGLTVNLHLLMVSFYRPAGRRRKLLIEHGAFPSDRYAAESQVRLHGLDPADALLEIAPRPGECTIRSEDLAALIERQGAEIALILLPGVQYYSGQLFDIREVTRLGHAGGALVGFDLAHAAGNVPLSLHDWGVDFAAWCTYKYLNAGPGALAGAFVHARHAQAFDRPRLAGWWGHDKATRFQMGPQFRPIAGAEGWQLSNPPVLAAAPLLGSLSIFAEATMAALRRKSLELTGYLERLIDAEFGGQLEILTPRDPAARGCQLSLRLTQRRGPQVHRALEAGGLVCDWREPDVVRLAPVPLYNTFGEVHRAVGILKQVLGATA